MSNNDVDLQIRDLREERALHIGEPPPDLTEEERELWLAQRLQEVASIDDDIRELERRREAIGERRRGVGESRGGRR